MLLSPKVAAHVSADMAHDFKVRPHDSGWLFYYNDTVTALLECFTGQFNPTSEDSALPAAFSEVFLVYYSV